MKTLLACLLLILSGAAAASAEPSKENLRKAEQTLDILTQAYGASRRLSSSDGLALLKFAELNHHLNLAAGPIIRDTFDPGVDADAWLRRHREGIIQCMTKVMQMKAQRDFMDDRGAKATILPILEGNLGLLAGLQQLQSCYANGAGNPEEGVATLRAGLRKRTEAGLPIVKKLRELSGSDQFDRDAAKILEETARAVSR